MIKYITQTKDVSDIKLTIERCVEHLGYWPQYYAYESMEDTKQALSYWFSFHTEEDLTMFLMSCLTPSRYATLVSPGVSFSVIDTSYFIPAAEDTEYPLTFNVQDQNANL